MIEYKCEKCNKIFDHKHNFIYHLKRKTNCNKQADKLKELTKNEIQPPEIVNVFDKKKVIKETKKKLSSYELAQKMTIYNKDLNDPICVYCNKLFSSNSHRNRHMNNTCDVRKRYYELIDVCDKEIDNLIVENKFLKNKYLNLFGDKYLFPFGMEKFSNVDIGLITNAIKNPYKGLPELTQKYHFNPKEMRYHNVRVKSPKSMHLEIYNGTNWNLESRENVITTLLRTYKDIVDTEVDKSDCKIAFQFIKAYNEFSEAIDYYISFILYDCDLTQEQKKLYKPIYQRIFTAIDLMIINAFRKDEN